MQGTRVLALAAVFVIQYIMMLPVSCIAANVRDSSASGTKMAAQVGARKLSPAASVGAKSVGGSKSISPVKGAKGSGEPIGDKWAVVIGISKFADGRIPSLKYASKDARDFYDYLVDENGGKFKKDHVKLLLNEDATKINIMDMLGDSFLPHAAGPNDLMVVYLSTHGSPSGADINGVNYVIAYDTRMNKLFATGIEMRQLLRTIKERVHTNRILLVLDTCYSGAGAMGHKGLTRSNVDTQGLAQGIGSLVISSSSPEQRAWESDNLKNSYFTRFFLDSLRDGTNAKTIDQAFAAMKQKVQEHVLREKGEMQTPVMAGTFSGPRLVLSAAPTQNRPAPITIPLSGESGATSSADKSSPDFSNYGLQMRAARDLIEKGKLFDAWHELVEATKSNPDSVEAQLVLSDVLDAQAKFMESLEAAKSAVRNGEESAIAREKLSRAYIRLKNPDEALRQAQKAATIDPQSSMAHFYLGQVYEKYLNKVDEAEQYYKKAIELNGLNAPALVALANLLYRQHRQPEELENLVRKALESDSDDPGAHLLMARLLYQRKSDYKGAEAQLTKAVAADPSNPILHAELGVVLSHDAERLNDAELEFKKAIELNANLGYPRAVYARYLLQKRDRFEEAENEYKKAINMDSDLDQARVEYGNLLIDRRQVYDEADNQFRKALQSNPKNALAHLGLARVKSELYKDYAGCEAELKKAIVLDPKLSQAYDMIGDVMWKGLGRYADAKQSYRKAIEVDPENASAHYHLAVLMLERMKENSPEAVLDELQKAVKFGPGVSVYQTKLGWVLQTYLKKFKEAEAAYRKAIEINIADSEAHLRLGLLLIEKFGQRKLGERELRTAQEQNPGSPEVKDAFERYVR